MPKANGADRGFDLGDAVLARRVTRAFDAALRELDGSGSEPLAALRLAVQLTVFAISAVAQQDSVENALHFYMLFTADASTKCQNVLNAQREIGALFKP
jgi:hypothetical protein